MGWFDWLKRSLENPRRPLDPWSQTLTDSFDGSLSATGVRITRTKALTVPAYWRALNLISRTVAKPAVRVMRNLHPGQEHDPDHPADYLLRVAPNEAMTPYIFKQLLISHAISQGNGYAYIFRDGLGRPRELWPLDPERTQPMRKDGKLFYAHELREGREIRILDAEDVFHLKGLGYDGLVGYPILQVGREALGRAVAMQTYGSVFFRNNARPNVILQHPGKLSPEARKQLRESWERLHSGLDNAHRTAVLEEGMQAIPLTVSARDAQLIEAMDASLVDIANLFGIPPARLGAATNVSYKSLEQDQQNFLDDAIDPWMVAFEEEAEAKLLQPRQRLRGTHSIQFDRLALVRADLQQRGAFYQQALASGWISPDEVRSREGLNPLPNGLGRTYFFPLNTQAVGIDLDGMSGPAVAPGASLLDAPDVRQVEAWDCGPAALASVLQFFGLDGDLRSLAERLGTTPELGTTPAAILAELSRVDLIATSAANLKVSDLTRFFAAGQPVLCPVQSQGVGHWVVVIGTGLGHVFLQDPAVGRRMVAEEEWLSSWQDVDKGGNRYEQYGIAVGRELLPVQSLSEPASEVEGEESQSG